MSKLFLGEPSGLALERTFDGIDGITVVGTGRTGREVSTAIRGSAVDILAFPAEWSELCRTVRMSLDLPLRTRPLFVIAADRPSAALALKTHLFGFDGIVDVTAPSQDVAEQVHGLLDRSRHVSDDPAVRASGLEHGLLARTPIVPDHDRDIADLVAGGLADDQIASLLGISIQQVRNRIERLIEANGLAYRTQLAILLTALVKVPDFS